jgi:16S rRNA U516 pseudouridylate synthase RsuA-like enzyme
MPARQSRNTADKARKPIRLQKILAAAGIDSRRKCEELILEGDVTVNGEVIDSLPAFADPAVDDIRVNGSRIKTEEKVYFMLNKPKNVICTSRDPPGPHQGGGFGAVQGAGLLCGAAGYRDDGAVALDQ